MIALLSKFEGWSRCWSFFCDDCNRNVVLTAGRRIPSGRVETLHRCLIHGRGDGDA